jgi:hypothetical protein
MQSLVQLSGDQRRPSDGLQRSSEPLGVPVPDVLLVDRVQGGQLERKGDFDEACQGQASRAFGSFARNSVGVSTGSGEPQDVASRGSNCTCETTRSSISVSSVASAVLML